MTTTSLSTLVLVDGPNIFNDIDRWLRSRTELSDDLRRDYLKRWFDIDRVIDATVGRKDLGLYRANGLGFVVFHSEKALGSGPTRLVPPDVEHFWQRQGSYDDTSTLLVSVPGHQPERMTGKCSTCGSEVTVESRAEKGVDTSMVTYLYEAAERWDQAVLFTNDADFVPPILALRRRGKRVFSAAIDTQGTSALKRASQSFFPIPLRFLEIDLRLFLSLQPGGTVDGALQAFEHRFGATPGDIRISADGDSCPTVVLKEPNEEREGFLSDLFGDQLELRWFPRNSAREGRLFYNTGYALGRPVRRHRDGFRDAMWSRYWND